MAVANDACKPINLGVLISGGGTTMLNLQARIVDGSLNARIGCVIASNPAALGVARARDAGLPVAVINRKSHAGHAGAADFSKEIAAELRRNKCDLVCMAGFLSLWIIPDDFSRRVMNIHPALLPKYGGRGMHGHRVHTAVLAAGETISGCTVHYADNQYDHGPIILRRTCPVLPDDTPETLAARVFEEECIAYPDAIRMHMEKPILDFGF